MRNYWFTSLVIFDIIDYDGECKKMDYISIDNFEGPLDLLLHLVKEANIDICDISIEDITNKYLDYINREKDLNINVSSSYLVMAAELMYIKSKSLLPVVKVEEEAEEEISRENLINKLIEYKKYKEMTPTFKKLEEERKNIFIKGPEKISDYTDSHLVGEASIDVLVEAFKRFLERKDMEKPLHTTVTNREYSVKERKNYIRNVIKSKGRVYLEELLEEENRPFIVVTFLSVLEMVKERDIVIKQERNFDRILVEVRN